MLANEIIDAEMQRDRQLVHFEALAVAKTFAFKPLQFLSHGQKCPLYIIPNWNKARVVLRWDMDPTEQLKIIASVKDLLIRNSSPRILLTVSSSVKYSESWPYSFRRTKRSWGN